MVRQAMVCSVIRHLAFEDLGSFAAPLEEAGFRLAYCDVGRDDPGALDPVSPELMIVLGGPIGAYEEARYPFLETEIGIIGERLESGRPLMGICLGAQLIARAAGARVYRAGPARDRVRSHHAHGCRPHVLPRGLREGSGNAPLAR